ncbi:MAG: type VI secretion system protein TssA [Polyangiaceae bacterium]
MAPLLAPIAVPQPAGSDPSYDPDFERIKAEIDKLSSVDAREPSWRDIRDVGIELLTKRAKDLRVAGWVGAAQVKLDGWSGFAEALVAYDGLARTFWDSMYPDARRARGRISAFAWFTELAAAHLQGLDSLAEADAVRASDELLRDLDRFLADKLGEGYAGAGALGRLVRERVASIPQAAANGTPPAPLLPDPPKAAAQAPPSLPDIKPGAAGPVAQSPAVAGDAESAVQESAQALLRASAMLRAANASQSQAYRLQRWGAWAAIQNPPPAEGDRTRIRPPPDTLPRRLLLLRDAQKWLELLLAAEEATGKYLFWLDLHRSVALAMDRLGESFLDAREVVGREVIAFVARFPSVVSLAFSNGTPFAEPATRSWLEEEGRRWGGAAAAAASSAASAEDEDVAKRFAEAAALVTSGQLAEGLGAAAALAARGADGRTRFRAALALGKMALTGSRPEIARAILDRLVLDVDHHDLEVWEPALCATLYASLLLATRDAARKRPAGPEAASREQAIFDKLCRLDPAAALKFAAG